MIRLQERLEGGRRGERVVQHLDRSDPVDAVEPSRVGGVGQIENVTTPRPMTHDLLRNVIHDLKADIQKIVVSDLKENTFYALIYLRRNGDTLAIAARPSDAIAAYLHDAPPGDAAQYSGYSGPPSIGNIGKCSFRGNAGWEPDVRSRASEMPALPFT